MFNAVEFVRVPQTNEDEIVIQGTVHIVPSKVIKVEPFGPGGQGLDTLITLSEGEPEIVEGPPSEVIRRLRTSEPLSTTHSTVRRVK